MRMSLLMLVCFGLLAQEGNPSEVKAGGDQLQAELKAANERISQLEERIKLMAMQQQGAVQFFQAGQALCELDKRQAEQITKTPSK